jgi:hypothetical protein
METMTLRMKFQHGRFIKFVEVTMEGWGATECLNLCINAGKELTGWKNPFLVWYVEKNTSLMV